MVDRLLSISLQTLGRADRATSLNDVGDNAPTNWEYPCGTGDVHVALAIYSRDDQSLEAVLEHSRQLGVCLTDSTTVHSMIVKLVLR